MGNVDGAERVYKEMVEKGVSPDVVVHHAMLNGLCMAGKTKECFKLWEVMEKCGCRNVV